MRVVSSGSPRCECGDGRGLYEMTGSSFGLKQTQDKEA